MFSLYSATALRVNLTMLHTIQIAKGVSVEIEYPRNYKLIAVCLRRHIMPSVIQYLCKTYCMPKRITFMFKPKFAIAAALYHSISKADFFTLLIVTRSIRPLFI